MPNIYALGEHIVVLRYIEFIGSVEVVRNEFPTTMIMDPNEPVASDDLWQFSVKFNSGDSVYFSEFDRAVVAKERDLIVGALRDYWAAR